MCACGICLCDMCVWYVCACGICVCVWCVAVCVSMYVCVAAVGASMALESVFHGGGAAMSRPHTLFRAAGPQPAEEPSPSCTNTNPGWETTVGKRSRKPQPRTQKREAEGEEQDVPGPNADKPRRYCPRVPLPARPLLPLPGSLPRVW